LSRPLIDSLTHPFPRRSPIQHSALARRSLQAKPAWAGFWPKAGNSPTANALNAATKYGATHRPEGLDWGPVRDLGADIIEGIRGVKSTDGPVVCHLNDTIPAASQV
jgi:hypothetical protein